MPRILVIEDEDELRRDIIEILKMGNFQALEASNGVQGVEMARQYLPDMILCDIMMAHGRGDWVLLEVRSDPSIATTPFIFITGKNTRSDMRNAMELGADDFIPKPFRSEELLIAIETQFEKRTARAHQEEQQLDDLRQNVLRAIPHELRTPLTGIMGYARMMLEDAYVLKPKEVQQMAIGIKRAALRLRRHFENYLLYAQLEFLQTSPDTNHLLNRTPTLDPMSHVQQIAVKKSVEVGRLNDLDVEHCGETVLVRITAEDLEKIIDELLDNAFKFSKSGMPVTVNCNVESDKFTLEIRDVGRGMTQEQINRIGAYMQFERRFSEHPGLGLGLVIARRLALLYGGQLEIESAVDQGTCVRVDLPLTQHN